MAAKYLPVSRHTVGRDVLKQITQIGSGRVLIPHLPPKPVLLKKIAVETVLVRSRMDWTCEQSRSLASSSAKCEITTRRN